jgi:predicted lysophospholipase L1 biosynthesis ABC-type transport system permease subunit
MLFLRHLRICPGRHMAFSALWLSVAAILATLEISQSNKTVLPENGRHFLPGTIVLCVSLNLFLICL